MINQHLAIDFLSAENRLTNLNFSKEFSQTNFLIKKQNKKFKSNVWLCRKKNVENKLGSRWIKLILFTDHHHHSQLAKQIRNAKNQQQKNEEKTSNMGNDNAKERKRNWSHTHPSFTYLIIIIVFDGFKKTNNKIFDDDDFDSFRWLLFIFCFCFFFG